MTLHGIEGQNVPESAYSCDACGAAAEGSIVLYAIRIAQLEAELKLKQQIIESYQVAFERMSWIARQDGG